MIYCYQDSNFMIPIQQLDMNFESEQSFEQQLSELLALIILFEKQIEQLKQKLAGNEEFHTRLIFQRLDLNHQGQIRAQDLLYVVGNQDKNINLENCQSFCRKHSISGALSYEEMLGIVVPKNHKSLSQRVLMRTVKRGASLPGYLWKYFCELIKLQLKMEKITELLRRKIQNSPTHLSHLDMVYFFKTCLLTPQKLWHFCNINSQHGEYSFEVSDANYLSNHIKSGNCVNEMTDEDIKEIICPLDMNFQKTVKEMGAYYENIKREEMKTMNGGFYEHKSKKYEEVQKPINFLNAKYVPSFHKIQEAALKNPPQSFRSPIKQNFLPNVDYSKISERDALNYNNLYLENFMKPSYGPSAHESRAIELDKFLLNNNEENRRNMRNNGYVGYQKFEDGLQGHINQSQLDSESAFVQY